MDTSALLSSVPTGLWIGGEERAGQSTFEVLNPATEDVIAHAASSLARFKCPTAVEFVPELPRGATGKVRKGRLRELA